MSMKKSAEVASGDGRVTFDFGNVTKSKGITSIPFVYSSEGERMKGKLMREGLDHIYAEFDSPDEDMDDTDIIETYEENFYNEEKKSGKKAEA